MKREKELIREWDELVEKYPEEDDVEIYPKFIHNNQTTCVDEEQRISIIIKRHIALLEAKSTYYGYSQVCYDVYDLPGALDLALDEVGLEISDLTDEELTEIEDI